MTLHALAIGIVPFSFLIAMVGIIDGAPPPFRPRAVGGLVGRFQPIVDIPVISARESRLDDEELVLGVTVGEQSRAYPINMLTGPQREILNDRLGGRAIAATW